MDELTIDGKAFISSKRAAQITGYAKDYIGQLCREGYVEARRVGRSWYVLEAAIKDHRFGKTPQKEKESPAVSPDFTLKREEPPVDVVKSLPPASHYEAVAAPSINLLRSDEEPAVAVTLPVHDSANSAAPQLPASAPAEDFHQAWQTWFDTFHAPAVGAAHEEPTEPEMPVFSPHTHVPGPADVVEPQSITETVPVSIHHLAPQTEQHAQAFEPLRPAALEPRLEDVMPRPKPPAKLERRGERGTRAFFSLLCVVVMAISIGIALVGTGYFEDSFTSFKPAQIIKGSVTYIK